MISEVNRKFFKLAVGKLKKDSTTDISTCCTICGDTSYRLHLFDPGGTDGLVKCFNAGCECENGMSVRQFLGAMNSAYLEPYKRATLTKQVEEIKDNLSMQDLLAKVNKPKVDKPPEKELPLKKIFKLAKDYPEAVKYLSNRNITPRDNWFFSKQKYFEYNSKHIYLLDYLLVPIITHEGKYKGFYSRSIHEKKFSTFLLDDTTKIWHNNPTSKPDIIAEGIFDALSTGYDNCSAMIGADLAVEYTDELPKNTIFAFDNDTTGTLKAIKYASMGFRVFVWPEVSYKDFNEMLCCGNSKIEIKQMIKDNIYLGIMAKTRLKMKQL